MEKLKAQWDLTTQENEEGEKENRVVNENIKYFPAPDDIVVESGVGQVTIRWDEIAGACGYLVFRSEEEEGPYEVIDHHGGDSVKAVPAPVYVDTTGDLDKEYWYAVASVYVPDHPAGALSRAKSGMAADAGNSDISLLIDAAHSSSELNQVWHMLGSEHLSQIDSKEMIGGVHIGSDFLEAFRIAQRELGTTRIRAHGIFLDELEVYMSSSEDGVTYNFTRIDAIYDKLLELGIRPVVELSFMPKQLALNPEPTVFHYQACISKPASWDEWSRLVQYFVQHLVDRYGLPEVQQWGFEVWNEPNLSAFWVDKSEEYLQMYKETVRAIKKVNQTLLVGGPATAAAGWVLEFIAFVQKENLPLDFLATHLYGGLPVDFRPILRANGFSHTQVWWTEWGVTPTHFAEINDSVFAAPFVLHGMKRSQPYLDALTYWVVSDHFEELGRGARLFHGGFGLLTIGNLRKPRFWALKLMEDMGQHTLPCELDGDGAGSLVDSLATTKENGEIHVLIWNGTMNQNQKNGCALLSRVLQVKIENVPQRSYKVTLARVDELHSNIARAWQNEHQPWPDESQWQTLRNMDHLFEMTVAENVNFQNGIFEYALDLPMPGIARIRLIPMDSI